LPAIHTKKLAKGAAEPFRVSRHAWRIENLQQFQERGLRIAERNRHRPNLICQELAQVNLDEMIRRGVVTVLCSWEILFQL
jgi:hypothetical protein